MTGQPSTAKTNHADTDDDDIEEYETHGTQELLARLTPKQYLVNRDPNVKQPMVAFEDPALYPPKKISKKTRLIKFLRRIFGSCVGERKRNETPAQIHVLLS